MGSVSVPFHMRTQQEQKHRFYCATQGDLGLWLVPLRLPLFLLKISFCSSLGGTCQGSQAHVRHAGIPNNTSLIGCLDFWAPRLVGHSQEWQSQILGACPGEKRVSSPLVSLRSAGRSTPAPSSPPSSGRPLLSAPASSPALPPHDPKLISASSES
jgi:hypothetical protein